MARTSYIVSGRDLRIRPRNRPGPGEPPDPEHPGEPGEPGYPPDEGDEHGAHPPPDFEIPVAPDVPSAPGLWVGPTAHNPVIPVPEKPDEGHHVKLPLGAIWPKPYGHVAGHYVALAYIPEHGWRYIVIDPDAWPSWEKPEAKPPVVPGSPEARRT